MLRYQLNRIVSAFVVAAGTLISGAVHAELVADPLPGDPRLVVFRYDENNSFRIYSRPMAVTHIVLQPDERVRFLALGDTSSWNTVRKDNHLFIKPNRAAVTTSGSLITNKREYQLLLVSTGEGGRWYQRVSFDFPGIDSLAIMEADAREVAPAVEGAGVAPTGAAATAPAIAGGGSGGGSGIQPQETVDLSKLNFAYETEGTAEFRPVTVYDDNKSTYIRLPEGAKVPALFSLVDGEPELIDYTLRAADVLVVPRVLAAALLKIGSKEVRVYNMKKMRKGVFGSYSEATK